MSLLPILPILVLGALFGTLSFRLIRSGLRSRGSELWLGAFFGFIALSTPLRSSAAMGVGIGLDPALANLLGQTVTALGMICLIHFVWRVFRGDSGWARLAFLGLSALIVAQLILFFATGAYETQGHPANMLRVAAMMLAIGWAFSESLRYWRMLQKRSALGLGDEVITNRFGLWTLWTGALLVFPVFNLTVRVVAFSAGDASEGVAITGEYAWAMTVARLFALVCGPIIAVCTWLIFFAPKWYLARITARAAVH